MKHLLCAVVIVFFLVPAMGQGTFEKGYFIDTENQKTECYIKIEDWSTQPTLTYMASWKDAVKTAPLKGIKEFGIVNYIKMVKAKVSIDISGDEGHLLSYQQEPEWITEDLFLKILVEGKVTLYAYEAEGLKRYFFNTAPDSIEQLVFKKYKTVEGVLSNNSYQTTLLDRVNCIDSTTAYFKKLRYTKADLVRHFTNTNTCEGAAFKTYEMPSKMLVAEKTEPVEEIVSRSPDIDVQSTGKSTSRSVQYISIEVNQLVRQLFNFGGNDNVFSNPYVLQYSFNGRKTGRGMSMGLTYSKTSFTDNTNLGSPRDTKNRSIFFRIGTDRKVAWGKKWTGVFGLDLLLSSTKEITTTNQLGGNILIESNTGGWGIGPRFGLMFHLSEKVFLGTEATFYYQAFNENTFQNGFGANTNQRNTNFSLTPPFSMYLIIKLRE